MIGPDQLDLVYSDECSIEDLQDRSPDRTVAFWLLEPTVGAHTIQDIQELADICHRVFLVYTELCNPMVVNLPSLDRPNVTWLLPGWHPAFHDRTIGWPYHLWRIAQLYREIPEPLDDLAPYAVKPMMFDALLGKHKRHRAFVRDSIKQHGIADLCVCRLVGRPNLHQVQDVFDSRDYVMEPDVRPLADQPRQSINCTVSYRDRSTRLDCIIPVSVYNQTAYTIVAETVDEHTIFLTEKTAKPMVAKRLFVVFTAMGFLAYLRSLGFRTFGSVIDESYDQEPDPVRRWTLAFQQVLYLCTQPQCTVLDKIKSTVEHNHALIMGDHLTDSTLSHIHRWLDL
jgi:hypothetical protein